MKVGQNLGEGRGKARQPRHETGGVCKRSNLRPLSAHSPHGKQLLQLGWLFELCLMAQSVFRGMLRQEKVKQG